VEFSVGIALNCSSFRTVWSELTSTGDDEKKGALHTVGGKVSVHSHCGKQCGASSKIKTSFVNATVYPHPAQQ
jgi:hypothetical protein